jgi:hypothetical protein
MSPDVTTPRGDGAFPTQKKRMHSKNDSFKTWIQRNAMYVLEYCRVDWKVTGASHPHGGGALDFINFREKKIMHRARAAWHRGFDSLPSQDPDPGRCQLYSSA